MQTNNIVNSIFKQCYCRVIEGANHSRPNKDMLKKRGHQVLSKAKVKILHAAAQNTVGSMDNGTGTDKT